MADRAEECKLIDRVFPKIMINITGRIMASSKISGLFVAPTKKMFFFAPTPSIYVSS